MAKRIAKTREGGPRNKGTAASPAKSTWNDVARVGAAGTRRHGRARGGAYHGREIGNNTRRRNHGDFMAGRTPRQVLDRHLAKKAS